MALVLMYARLHVVSIKAVTVNLVFSAKKVTSLNISTPNPGRMTHYCKVSENMSLVLT